MLEISRAEKFAQDMQRYEHARLFETLSAAKERWELKNTRKRFLAWKRRVKTMRKAQEQVPLHEYMLTV